MVRNKVDNKEGEEYNKTEDNKEKTFFLLKVVSFLIQKRFY